MDYYILMIIIYKCIYIKILLLKFRSNKWNSDKWSSTIFVALLLLYTFAISSDVCKIIHINRLKINYCFIWIT